MAVEPEDEAPTLAADRHVSDQRSAELTRNGSPSQDALILSDSLHYRYIAIVVLLLGVAVLLLVAAVGGGHPLARAFFSGTVVLLIVVTSWVQWRPGRRDLSRGPWAVAVVVTYCLAGVGLLAFWGVYSPATAITCLVLYVYASRTPTRLALLGYTLIAVPHGALWLGIVLGVLPDDLGVVTGHGMRPVDEVVAFVFSQALYAIAILLGRMSRRAAQDSVQAVDQAVRTVAVRDALLNEARLSLQRAQSGPGLLSGQHLGPYVLGPVIGRGGMGEVYSATHLGSDEPAALKVLHRGRLGDAHQELRLLREAAMVADLDVPNVARVLAHSGPADPLPYIAMELLEGDDLAMILREQSHLPVSEVVDMVTQCAAGLAAAHSGGVIHRDIKPSNLFRTHGSGGPIWKILDFGVSTTFSASGTLTRGDVVGTPAFMPPEQTSGHRVDARADQYALAMVAYRALTGCVAFRGDAAEVFAEVRRSMPPAATALVTLPSEVDAVLAIGLAKRAEDRFGSVSEFATAFAAATRGALDPRLRERAADLIRRWPWRPA